MSILEVNEDTVSLDGTRSLDKKPESMRLSIKGCIMAGSMQDCRACINILSLRRGAVAAL